MRTGVPGGLVFRIGREPMFRNLISALAFCILVAADGLPAFASPFMPVGASASPPRGFVDFCQRHPGDCRQTTLAPRTVHLTAGRSAELERVQIAVNRRIFYTRDSANYGRRDYWNYPFLFGDCEDFALEKRRRLIGLGWPRSALLLTTVRMRSGSRHVVLAVVTDQGERVLDNYADSVVAWQALDYEWLGRQSRFDESAWVRIPGI